MAKPIYRTQSTRTHEEATAVLARLLRDGEPQRVDWEEAYGRPQDGDDPDEEHEEEAAYRHLQAAERHGREWDWARAGRSLRLAYRALGAAPSATDEDTGVAWHRGEHPVQEVARG